MMNLQAGRGNWSLLQKPRFKVEVFLLSWSLGLGKKNKENISHNITHSLT
jgi:hypothetical protein